MSKKPKRPFIKGATGANMLALHAKRPDFLLAQTKAKRPSKDQLLGSSMLEPHPELRPVREALAISQELSQEQPGATVKHRLSEGEASVPEIVKARVSRSELNFSVVALTEIADKLGRVVPSVYMVDNRVWLDLKPSERGYAWTPYGVEGYSRFSVSHSTMAAMGADKIDLFGMTDAETVEFGVGGVCTVILPEHLQQLRTVTRKPESRPRRSPQDRQPPTSIFRTAGSNPGPKSQPDFPPEVDLDAEDLEFQDIADAITILQQAKRLKKWSGLKFSVDEEGSLHAEISWKV